MRDGEAVIREFGEEYVRRLVKAGWAFRSVIVWIVVVYVTLFVTRGLPALAAAAGTPADALAIALFAGLALLIRLAVTAGLLVHVWRCVEALEREPALWLVAMFIPLASLIALVRLSELVQERMKRAGVKVGFLGPDPRSLRALERALPEPAEHMPPMGGHTE